MHLLLKTICALFFVLGSFGLLAQEASKVMVDTSEVVLDSLSEGERLFREAEELEKEKKWEKAIEKYNEALMVFSKLGNIDRFSKCTGNITDLCIRDRKEKWIEFHNEKIEFFGNNLGNKNIQTGLWHFQLGRLLFSKKQYDLARESAQKALGVISLYEDRMYNMYLVNSLLGNIYWELSQLGLAEIYYTKSLDLISQMLKNNLITDKIAAIDQARMYKSLGVLKSKENKESEEALTFLNKAAANELRYEEYLSLADTYTRLGIFYLESMNFVEAETYIQKAISYFEEDSIEDKTKLIWAYSIHGNIYTNLLEDEKAIDSYEKGLRLNTQFFGEETIYSITINANLGRIYEMRGEINRAEILYKNSLNYFEKIYKHPHSYKIWSYYDLGLLWANQKEKFDSSLIMLNKALFDLKEIHEEPNPEIARAYNYIATVYRNNNRPQNALASVQNALIANTYQFNKSNLFQNPEPTDFIDLFLGTELAIKKAVYLYDLWVENKEDKVLPKQIKACLELTHTLSIKKIINLGSYAPYENALRKINEDNIQRAVYQNYHFYDQSKEQHFIEDCFYWMERGKAKNLSMLIRQLDALEFSKIPKELINEEKILIAKIDSIEQLMHQAFEKKDSLKAIIIQSQDLFQAKKNKELFANNIKTKYPDYYQLKFESQPIKSSELSNYLNENTLFIEFLIDKIEETNRTFTFVLSNSKEHIFKTDLSSDYAKKITTFNKLLRSHNLLRADRRRKFIELSHELYNQFIKPIEHLLEGKERLVIVGEGVTHYLPFEALLKSNEDKPWHELDFLIKDHEISYHYSGTLFARAQTQKTKFENELLAFAPVFSEEENTLTTLRENGLVMVDSTFRSVEGDNFLPLPYSEKEVKNICQLFPKSSNVNVLLNENANEQNLKSALEKNHRFVHIASHSFANIDYPKFSGIACADSNSENEKDDGILYVGEIYNLAVNSDLVVLSSCESGVGKLLEGEGMLGLNRSFVYAGVPNVIFSLWKVYDEMTGKMMTEFYKNTLNGDSYSKALRAAKLKMLENPTTATPDIWGAFLLVGR